MKLSEAIRLGAMMRPQVTEAYFDRRGSCALGAALEAVGTPIDEMGLAAAEGRWPMLTAYASNPADGRSRNDLTGVIFSLNDDHGWSREDIADYVETLERAQEPVIATAPSGAMEPAVELGALAQKSYVHVAKGTR